MTEQASWVAKRLPGARRQDRPKKAPGEFRRVVRLYVHHTGGRKLYLLALGMLVFEAITSVFEAYPLAFLIDFLQNNRDGLTIDVPFLTDPRDETVAVLTFGLIVLVSVNSLADSMAEIYLARGGRNLGYNIREALYHKLQRLSLAFHDQRRTGDVLTRVTSDVTALEEFIVKSFGDLAGGVLVLLGTLIFLLAASWQVAIVAILIVPVMSFISNYFSERIKVASKRQRSHEGDLANSAQEMLTSIRVVQTYGRSGYEERRFGEQSRKSMEAALDTAGLQAKFSWVVAVMEALATTVVVWLGLFLLDRGSLTVGTLVLFVILIENMFKPTKKIIREWTKIGKIFAAAERISEVLDREPAVADRPDAVDAPPLRGDLRFRDVSFAYQLEAEDIGDQPADTGRRVALEHVSFSAAPGEVVALIGHSGAGKSTMAQLIPRLYDPDEGVVLMDGTDIRTFTLASLRSQIGVVLQDTVLFSGTVAENIAYGREDASREEVVEAARKANAHDFIVELPEGYDTVLGERASNLSGGQRQRIAIARAFIRAAPILILDEPTTGLDAQATEQVVKGLRSLIEGKTTIIISHNLRLIRSADRILVVEGGRIVQSGTHAELSRQAGVYAELGLQEGSGSSIGGGDDRLDRTVEPAVRAVAQRLRRQVDRARRWAEGAGADPVPSRAARANGKPANGRQASGRPAKRQPANERPAREPAANGGPAKGGPANGRSTIGPADDGGPANEQPASGKSASGKSTNGGEPNSGPASGAQVASGTSAKGGPANGEPTNRQPANAKRTNRKPTNGEPANGTPANGKSTKGQVVHGQPTNERAANGQPADEQAAGGKAANGRPANRRPANRKPTNGKPTNGKPTNGKPTNGRPANGKPTNGEAANGRRADEQAASGKAADGRPANRKPTKGQVVNGRPANETPADEQPTNGEPSNGKPAKEQVANGKPANGKPANGRKTNEGTANGGRGSGGPAHGLAASGAAAGETASKPPAGDGGDGTGRRSVANGRSVGGRHISSSGASLGWTPRRLPSPEEES